MRFLSTLLVCSGLLFGCSGGSDSENTQPATDGNVACDTLGLKIIDGVVCTISTSPVVQLLIQYGTGDVGLCTGTALTSRKILTAAHCFLGASVNSVTITNDAGLSIAAESIDLHPAVRLERETGAVFNDIAVVTAAAPLPVRTSPLLATSAVIPGDTLGIFGYGLDNDGNAGALRAGTMLVTDVTPNHIVAVFREGSNTCGGDSGGPADLLIVDPSGFTTNEGTVGVTSSGSAGSECREGDRSLFANLSSPEIISFLEAAAPGAVILQ